MKFRLNIALVCLVSMASLMMASFSSAQPIFKRDLLDGIDWTIPQNHQFLVGYLNARNVPGFDLTQFIIAHPLVLPERFKTDPRYAMILNRYGVDRDSGVN
ncbi:hypothetical protein H4219_005207 [Mycoemilia scoparia]|uniref:ABC transporter substrate-binding protein n=1 Tax=Mycoemilia scoparia TaxID=417184 RepID=A0A9W7ZX28_9FUNG|nr:hypothetical protein H4219_005207 [Mycoemilia scoparia]